MEVENIEILNVSEVDQSLLKRFHCNEPNLAAFLNNLAITYNNAGIGNTTVIIDDDRKAVIGYYTLKCTNVKVFDEEMHYEPRFIPAIEVSRFAVDKKYEGIGFGKQIFSFALDVIDDVRKKIVGVQAVILFSLPDVTAFYEKFGFQVLDKTMAVYKCSENEDCICMYTMLT